jgi:hypothetical protein
MSDPLCYDPKMKRIRTKKRVVWETAARLREAGMTSTELLVLGLETDVPLMAVIPKETK